MLAAMVVPRESFRRKKSSHRHQKKAMMLKKTVWNVGNNEKKGSWEQAAVA